MVAFLLCSFVFFPHVSALLHRRTGIDALLMWQKAASDALSSLRETMAAANASKAQVLSDARDLQAQRAKLMQQIAKDKLQSELEDAQRSLEKLNVQTQRLVDEKNDLAHKESKLQKTIDGFNSKLKSLPAVSGQKFCLACVLFPRWFKFFSF